MRRAFFQCGLILLVMVRAATAQEELVAQSGEHDTFSRIVLPLAEEVEWNISQEGRSARISFPDLDATMSVEGLVASLPAGRLKDIRTSRGLVELDLGCACSVDIFRFDGRFVVIDVVDNPVAREQTDEVIRTLPRIAFDSSQPNHIASLAGQAFNGAAVEVDQEASVQTEQVFSEDVLAVRMADAVASQLLAPSGVLSRDETGPAGVGPVQIEINTPFRNQPPQIAIAQQDTCLLPAYADIGKWGSPEEILQSIGSMRREIFNDSGQVIPESADSLAAAYIALGFGVEARSVLDLNRGGEDLLRALTYVVDGAPSPAYSRLRQAYSCPNGLAFWAVLSAGSLPNEANLNENAVEVTLAAMRPEYRDVYAGTIIARLRSGGYEEAARQIEGLMARSSDQDGRPPEVYDPGALAQLAPEERLATLRVLAFGNTPVSAAALRALLEEHMQTRIALDDALLTFAGSFVETVEDDEVRVGIHAGLLFGLVLSGYPFEALQAYERLLLIQPEHAMTHLDALVSLATDVVPGDEFALFVVGLGDLITSDTVATETSLNVARRMVNVGMPSKALQLMTRRDLDNSSEKRLISAKAFLAMGDPLEALARVVNLSGDEAREIRAHAFLRMGQYDKAFPYLAETDPLRAPAGWIAQRPDATEAQPVQRQEILEQVNAIVASKPEQTMTGLLSETVQIRSTIEALLRE